MLGRRWLFFACVTLCQACDSKPKEAAPPPKPVANVPNWNDIARGTELPDVQGTPLGAGPHVIATESGILVGGAVIEQIEDGMIPLDTLDADGEPLRLGTELDKLDRAIDTLHLLVHPALPSKIVFQILQAAPPWVTRFVLVVRRRDNVGGVAVRRKSTAATQLDVGRTELKLGAQVIATEPAAQRTTALDAALRAVRGKSIEISVDPVAGYQVLAEIAATAAPYFEELRIAAAPREGLTMMSLNLYISGPLASQIDNQPLVDCVKDALPQLQDVIGLRVRVRFTLDDKGAISNVVPVGRHVPAMLARCLTIAVHRWKLKLPAGEYEVPMDLRPK